MRNDISKISKDTYFHHIAIPKRHFQIILSASWYLMDTCLVAVINLKASMSSLRDDIRFMVRILTVSSKISYDNESTYSKCALHPYGGHIPTISCYAPYVWM